jgi:hypothetical protein
MINFINFRKSLLVAEGKEDKTSTPQDGDIDDRKGSQPSSFHKGIKTKSTKIARDKAFQKGAKMDDDDPNAYKPAPGDSTAKTEPSQYTKKYKKMFGETSATDNTKDRIDQEKNSDGDKHDRMMDLARLQDVRKKNRNTK